MKTNYGSLPIRIDGGKAQLVRGEGVSGSTAMVAPSQEPVRGRQTPSSEDGFDSKLEAAYASVLKARQYVGEVKAYWHHPFRLSLATKCSYQPDFMLLFPDGHIEVHEVKGYAREDAIVKLKVAARIFSLFTFILVTRKEGLWEHCPIR